MFAGFFFGVRLDDPIGNIDGTFRGKRYFDCTPGYGVFVAPPDVRVKFKQHRSFVFCPHYQPS